AGHRGRVQLDGRARGPAVVGDPAREADRVLGAQVGDGRRTRLALVEVLGEAAQDRPIGRHGRRRAADLEVGQEALDRQPDLHRANGRGGEIRTALRYREYRLRVA